ncbi:NadS family protein [Thalassolituus oleivorans]|uniref:NadS family protein n=1 Tax=Thalassolituus oleivorans TaxID=187493 RepID=UPI00042DD949|nr:NadS family protein [Thalassolituus oleivorans]AHK15224.1 DNA-binding protein [Thalassolituus oleivorans R6-15]
MKDELFNQLMQSVQEADGILKGKQAPARATQIEIPDVKAIREATGLSQRLFANMIGVSLRTLQNWEQNRRTPDGPARALLLVVKKNPMVVMEALGS